MALQRINTVRLSFKEVPEKLSSVDIHLWISNTFHLQLDEVISITFYLRHPNYHKRASDFEMGHVLRVIQSVFPLY